MFLNYPDPSGWSAHINVGQIAYVLWPTGSDDEQGRTAIVHFAGTPEPLRLHGLTPLAVDQLETELRQYGVKSLLAAGSGR